MPVFLGGTSLLLRGGFEGVFFFEGISFFEGVFVFLGGDGGDFFGRGASMIGDSSGSDSL